MSDTVTLIGQGGAETVFGLPLSENTQNQIASGQVVPKTNEDRLKLNGEPEEEETPVEIPDVISGDVPDGTISDVLEWVGDDIDRAVDALTVEQAADNPRSTLIASLSDIIGG